MNLSVDRMNFLGGLLKSTTIAAILIAHPVAANSLTTQGIAQITSPTAVAIDGSSDRSMLRDNIGDATIGRLNLNRDRTIVASQPEDPPPPRRREHGGSF
jgi:hypothetical protein